MSNEINDKRELKELRVQTFSMYKRAMMLKNNLQ